MNPLSIVALILIIGLVIFVHEFGHFLIAKLNGIGVVQFSIGMGPNIFSWVRNGTRYCLKWIPFGGACQMLGDDGGIYDQDEVVTDNEKSFFTKSVWARISVIAAGPIFNFIFAFILAVIVLTYAGTDKSVLTGITEQYPAEAAGLQAGDEIVKINGESIHLFREIQVYLNMNAGKEMDVEYVRDGQTYSAHIEPKQDRNGNWLMGIQGGYRYELDALDTLKYSFYEVKYTIVTTVKSLGMIFTGGITINDFSGPVGIATMVDDLVDDVQQQTQDYPLADRAMTMFLTLTSFMILISANLGVMNLLPIPGLDGGRLLFLLIEAVRGKPVPREKEGYVQMAGFIFLMVFMVIVLFNDIRKIFI